MKRLLLAGVSALMLSACGSGGGSVVSANSADSTEITAVGTIVGNVTSNATTDSTVVNNAAAAAPAIDNATVSQDAASTADDVAPAGNDSGQ